MLSAAALRIISANEAFTTHQLSIDGTNFGGLKPLVALGDTYRN
jgi:hypothetical protein